MTENNKAKELVEKVAEQKDRGSELGAKQAFTRHWRQAVTEMPPRLAIVLVAVNQKTAKLALKRIRDQRPPELKLSGSLQQGLQVNFSRGKKNHLGNIPARELQILRQFGNKALRVYRPQLLEISRDQDSDSYTVAIELLRPELNICSSCGKTFYDPKQVNCPSCRQKRRRRGEQRFEHPPVELHEAVEEIIKNPEG